MKSTAKKVTAPDFVGKKLDCNVCGGTFSVTPRTAVQVVTYESGLKRVIAHCPYCGEASVLDTDPHQQFRKKLSAFILSQVKPIRAIEDESIRIPMQKLLDDFNRLVQED